MKARIVGLLILMALFCPNLRLISQTLEIHQMSVGQGDAALIVVRDTGALAAKLQAAHVPLPKRAERYKMITLALDSGTNIAGTCNYAVLIDAGLGSVQAKKIKDYMDKIGVGKVQVMMLSHFHADHVGGFKTLINTYGVVPDSAFYRAYAGKKPNPSTTSRKGFVDVLRDQASNPVLRTADPNLTEINLGDPGNAAIKMTCITANGSVMYAPLAKRVVSNDENNYSVCWLIQYKGFRFYTGGDLNGMEYTLGDLETPMIDAVKSHDLAIFKDTAGDTVIPKGHICAFKANHHGGQESSNDYFLSQMKPKVALVSCGFSRSYYHPKIEVLKSLDASYVPNWNVEAYQPEHAGLPKLIPNTIKNYYLTSLMVDRDPKMLDRDFNNLYSKVGNLANTNGIIGGDLVLIVDDNNIDTKSNFAVYWNAEKPPVGVATGSLIDPAPVSSTKYYHCHKADNAANVMFIPNH